MKIEITTKGKRKKPGVKTKREAKAEKKEALKIAKTQAF